MEKVRIGNDLMVNFSVYRNGEPESFDGATNISTKIVNESYNKTIAHTYAIVDNVIQFNIDALELKQCGKCRVFISYTKDGDYTVDSPAFELVQYTEDTGGTEVIGIEIVKINISGDIGINRDGASAYEVWEAYPGNEGKTIEQYFEWLHENPTKIDLDGLNSNLDKLHFKPDTLVQLANIGDVRYSQESRTLEVKVSDTVSIQLGQEMQTRVKNDEAIQINNGQMVYINSAVGANPLAKIASTSNADIAQRTFGMATENIPANGFGAITTEGLVRDINTSAFPEGSMLWLGTNGSVTNIEPTAPTSKISIGMVLRSNANNGVVYVKIRAIARNQKLSDVYAPTLTGGDILRWNSTTLRFETFNITSALSTKVDTSRTITAGNGLTGGGDLSADRTINVVAADDSLTVTSDNIKVNTNNTLTSTSTTQPLSANQGKVLNEKVAQVETDLNQTDIKNAEQDASIKSIEQLLSQSNMNQTAQVSNSGREIILLPKTASNGGMDIKLEGLTATQLVENGNFAKDINSDGIADGWSVYGQTGFIMKTVSDNTQYLKSGSSDGYRLINPFTTSATDLFYLAFTYKTSSSAIGFYTNNRNALPSSTSFTKKSFRTNLISAGMRFTFDGFAENDELWIKNAIGINLTATFGAGNEPDLATCDVMFSRYFDGTKSFIPAGRLKSVGKNLFDKRKVTFSNKYIDAMDGLLRIGTNKLYCYTDFIDVGMASTYVRNIIKGSDNTTFYSSITYWDRDRKFISGEWSTNAIFTKPATAKYVKLSTSTNRSLDDMIRFNDSFMFQVGTISTYYEQYKETKLYLTAPDLRSNGLVKDEVRKGLNGYEHVKRVGVGTLGAELITNVADREFDIGYTWLLNGNWTIADGVLTRTSQVVVASCFLPLLTVGNTYSVTLNIKSYTSGGSSLFVGDGTSIGISVNVIGAGSYTVCWKALNPSLGIWNISNFLGSIESISVKKVTTNEGVALNSRVTEYGTNVHYTLDTPIITPIDHAGILNSAESGTVFHEPVVADAGVYGTNISILNTTYPISSLEEIMVHTNVDTYLDVSKAVIASDGLSFTHPDLRAGDLVLFTYFFSKEKVNGLITATYYDGRYVIADTSNGKFYKWGVKSTNGVATIQLTEV